MTSSHISMDASPPRPTRPRRRIALFGCLFCLLAVAVGLYRYREERNRQCLCAAIAQDVAKAERCVDLGAYREALGHLDKAQSAIADNHLALGGQEVAALGATCLAQRQRVLQLLLAKSWSEKASTSFVDALARIDDAFAEPWAQNGKTCRQLVRLRQAAILARASALLAARPTVSAWQELRALQGLCLPDIDEPIRQCFETMASEMAESLAVAHFRQLCARLPGWRKNILTNRGACAEEMRSSRKELCVSPGLLWETLLAYYEQGIQTVMAAAEAAGWSDAEKIALRRLLNGDHLLCRAEAIYVRLPVERDAAAANFRALQEDVKSRVGEHALWPETTAALAQVYLSAERAKTGVTAMERSVDKGDAVASLHAAVVRALRLLPLMGMRWDTCARSMFGFSAEVGIDGCAMKIHAPSVWFGKSYIVEALGYRLQIPWHLAAPGALARCLQLARAMRLAGIPPSVTQNWQLRDGPFFPLALAPGSEGRGGEKIFCLFRLYETAADSAPARKAADDFIAVCRALREAVQNDENLPEELRQILGPTLQAAFQAPDRRDYLDADICRLALADGYVERYLPEVAQRHGDMLKRYGQAFAQLQRTHWLRLGIQAGPLTITVMQPAEMFVNPHQRIMDPPSATAEEIAWQNCIWQVYDRLAGQRRYCQRYPASSPAAFYIETADSAGQDQPRFDGKGELVVFHPVAGKTAIKQSGTLAFDNEAWRNAVLCDWHQAESPEYGGVALAFPPHLPLWQKDGRPAALAVSGGILRFPVFAAQPGPARRAEQDAYLDKCAAVLREPGELALLMRYFIQYSLDSPLARTPCLIGNSMAHGDYHQNVYEMLDRQIAGRILGDCEDVAELYQDICRRQGKMAYILALPSHAACAYVERKSPPTNTGNAAIYRLTLLQSGPPFTFENADLAGLLQQAEEPFLRNVGESRMTSSQVPFLFRFAGEQVRTTYWLSSRVFIDPDYAEILIRVQSYWHFHVYHRAIAEMEKRLQVEREVADLIELASLYRRVKRFTLAIPLQREVVAQMRQRDTGSLVKELTDLAAMCEERGDREAAEEIVAEIERLMQNALRRGRSREYAFMQFARLMVASLLASMEMPVRGVDLLRLDMQVAQNVPEDDLPLELASTLVAILQTMVDSEQKDGAALAGPMAELRNSLEILFRRALVVPDDDFNAIVQKYSLFGRYAICCVGREEAQRRLLADVTYPTALPKPGERRERALFDDEDWMWFRVSPGIFTEMMSYYLNHRRPEHFAPERAIPLAEALLRGYDAAKRLGSMEPHASAAAFASLFLAAMRRDLGDAERLFAVAAERGSTEQQKDLAETLGRLLRFLPLADVPLWLEAFHRHLPQKQFYLNIAYQAVDADAFDHALAAAEYACKIFPDDEDFRIETAALASDLPLLKRQYAGITIHLQRRAARERFAKAIAKADFAAAATAADEMLALSKDLGDCQPLVAEALLLKARAAMQARQSAEAASCAEQALNLLAGEVAPEYRQRVLRALRQMAALCQAGEHATLRQALEERRAHLEAAGKQTP